MPGTSARSATVSVRQPRQLLLDGLGGQLTCDLVELGDRPGDPDRRGDAELGEEVVDVACRSRQLGRCRRVGTKESLAQTYRADVEARPPRAEDELGRAAADVEDERGLVGCADAPPGQLRLLVPGQEAGREPESACHLGQELRSVFGIARGARRDDEGALGPEPPDLLPERIDGRERPCDRLRQEPATGVDALRRAASPPSGE